MSMPSSFSTENEPEPISLYLTIDGDDIGRKITACYLENNEEKLADISNSLSCAVSKISELLKSEGFKLIFSAADGIVGVSTDRKIDFLRIFEMIQKLAPSGITFSAGVATSLKEAYCALTYAKCIGKNNLVNWALV